VSHPRMSIPIESTWSDPAARPTDERPSVLVVDDEEKLARAYSRLLTSAGYQVDMAHDGAAALEKFTTGRYEVILSDLAMPHMNGIDFLKAVREIDRDVPFILITAAATTESAVRALEYGALRYLLKPVESADLERAVSDAVHLGQMARLHRKAEQMFGDYKRNRAEMDAALTRAISTIHMVYQPIVCWSTKSVYGYEALVRSKEPALPHPGALFDAAERLGRVEEVGRVIRDLIPAAAKDVPSGVRVFVNLHTADLNDEHLFSKAAPLSTIASNVILEVTERASLAGVDDVHARVSSLRDLGYRIAIDDIGAGYAGLTSFAMLEPDVVKLDMALVRDVDKLVTKQKVIRSMTTLCQDLKISIIAEGVETVEERDTLVTLGCDLLQGYLFGRPAGPFAAPTF